MCSSMARVCLISVLRGENTAEKQHTFILHGHVYIVYMCIRSHHVIYMIISKVIPLVLFSLN